MNPLIEHLLVHFPRLSDQSIQLIHQNYTLVHKKKGELLLQEGQVARKLFFLAKGLCRYFTNKDGQDITTWFGFENEFVTSFTSFFPKEPSYESIVALTDCDLYQIDYTTYQAMNEASIELERISTSFIIRHAVQLEQRIYVIQSKKAAEKYQYMLENRPHFIQHIPNKYLASYLGITRETLSRIRSQTR